MRDKVLAWMRAQDMTQPGDTVVCAVSGGADSVCMLHVLLSLRDALGITVEAAHFNHHLRGAESDRDEAFVRQLCKTLGVHLYVDGGDVQSRAACTHESIEEAARKLRGSAHRRHPHTNAHQVFRTAAGRMLHPGRILCRADGG